MPLVSEQGTDDPFTQAKKGQSNCATILPMAASRCRVSFSDCEGVLHALDVDAESLYEAVALAVASFREDDVSPSAPGPTTEFTVAVYRNPVEHKIRLQQVMKWSERTTEGGPAGIVKRQRVRTLLGHAGW